MGQDEVLKILTKHKDKWFTSKEISEILKISQGCVMGALKKMADRGEILRKPKEYRRHWLFNGVNPYIYKAK